MNLMSILDIEHWDMVFKSYKYTSICTLIIIYILNIYSTFGSFNLTDTLEYMDVTFADISDQNCSDTIMDCIGTQNEAYNTSIDIVSADHVCMKSDVSSFCSGDSGGPLIDITNISEPILVGVVSQTCFCQIGVPMIYSDVCYFKDWLQSLLPATDAPTSTPTSIPTINPTFSPTLEPTLIPTLNPSQNTSSPTVATAIPSSSPICASVTCSPTFIPVLQHQFSGMNLQGIQEKLSTEFFIVTVILASISIIIALIGLIDAKCIHPNDIFGIKFVVFPFFYLYDQVSDIFASINIYYEYKYMSIPNYNMLFILFMISISFIIIPSILSLIQLSRAVNKLFITDKHAGQTMSKWMLNYSYLMYLLSILFGSSFGSLYFLNVMYFYMYSESWAIKLNKIYRVIG